jgi:hypothetical protein
MNPQSPETLTGKLLALDLNDKERALLDLILQRASSVEEQLVDAEVAGYAQRPAPKTDELVTPARIRQASGTLNLLCNHNPVICWEYS